MTAYYNEHDAYAASWLEGLIAAGHIAPGIVDRRDIRDVAPHDLKGFTQCHFFAGIGIWSHALRGAGWSDDRPIWTGSCPCQPFSAAGRAGGFADERHLWPHWFYLIAQCRPPVVAGEQVASKDGLGWLDLVSADLEGAGYAFGATDLCAAGIGVEWEESQAGEWLQRAIHDCSDPVIGAMLRDFAGFAGAGNLSDGGKHIRQRSYFVGVADADDGRCEWRRSGEASDGRDAPRLEPERLRDADRLDHHHHQGSQRHAGHDGEAVGYRQGSERPASASGVSDGLGDSPGSGRQSRPREFSVSPEEADDKSIPFDRAAGNNCGTNAPASGRNAADWLFCRDGKWRSVGPGTFPLVNAAPARVGRLRAYGNGLDAKTATEFARTIREIIDGEPDAPVRCDGRMTFEDILG